MQIEIETIWKYKNIKNVTFDKLCSNNIIFRENVSLNNNKTNNNNNDYTHHIWYLSFNACNILRFKLLKMIFDLICMMD